MKIVKAIESIPEKKYKEYIIVKTRGSACEEPTTNNDLNSMDKA